MDFFVASTSEHKTLATETAVCEASQVIEMLKLKDVNVIGKKTKSGVNAQPETTPQDNETLRGACNRMDDLKKIIGKTRYDLLIAFENGIESKIINGRTVWYDYCWVVVEDAEGKRYYAHSAGIEIAPDIVDEARRRGFETTTIGDIIAERASPDTDPTNPHSNLTSHTVERLDLLKETVQTILSKLYTTILQKNIPPKTLN